MKIHLLSGFLGSGKTTAIRQACSNLLQQNKKVGVITNDQGIQLVDSNFFESLHIPNRKVVNGCFCCNYNALDAGIQSLIDINNPDVIFAESVGSCTDIVATVFKPLLQLRSDVQVTVSTFADVRLLQMILENDTPVFDETVNYIYHKQLEEAGIIVVNKIDLINAGELEKVKKLMTKKYSSKTVLYLSVTNHDDIQKWLQTVDKSANVPLSSLTIDYDIYGAGEAKLAWLDEEITINSANATAIQSAFSLTKNIYQKIQVNQYAIAHLKFWIDDHTKLSYNAIAEPEITCPGADSSAIATLLINARVQTTPGILSELVKESIQEIAAETNSIITVNSLCAFQPGYPRPTYRMAD